VGAFREENAGKRLIFRLKRSILEQFDLPETTD
jgi:hypothetical protein